MSRLEKNRVKLSKPCQKLMHDEIKWEKLNWEVSVSDKRKKEHIFRRKHFLFRLKETRKNGRFHSEKKKMMTYTYTLNSSYRYYCGIAKHNLEKKKTKYKTKKATFFVHSFPKL